MFRFVLFLLSYGLCVASITQCILYLNYRTLGYSWHAVIKFLLQTVELYIALGSLIVMFAVIYDLGISRSS
ncbi:hypothetical protein AAGS61_18750 [Lysinibacillus sp. KU-BSD001]|uniref:hypothetical protein n=1 Tax=Lysinibacillus sp. KU-BSD001 TaxID=3141328 RepID=UPI0036E4676B